jgi:hypothetical protein
MAEELFDSFIAAHPHYAHAFLNPAAARERMTRETLEALVGLAEDAWWVPSTIANFVDLHRNYADFDARDYAAWFELVIAAMERRAGSAWPQAASVAWRRQAERLTRLVAAELTRGAAAPASLAR